MKTEINFFPEANVVVETVVRPAMVNEVTGAMPLPRRAETVRKVDYLNLLERRLKRRERRAIRAIATV